MNLSNLIDLIAEVAAKNTAREGKSRTDAPDQAGLIMQTILAIFGRVHRIPPGP